MRIEYDIFAEAHWKGKDLLVWKVKVKLTKLQCKPLLEFLQVHSPVLQSDKEFLYPLVSKSKSLFLFPRDPLRVWDQ